MREPTYYETRSTRFQSHGRPKRTREEHYGPLPPTSSSFTNTSSSERLGLTVPIRIPPLRPSTNSSATAPSSSSININNDEPPPALLLLGADLWAQFHEHQNEMIITKCGRCLFPCLQFNILGLDPDSYYSLRLDFEMVTPSRFRFFNGAWKVVEPFHQVDGSSSSGRHDSRTSTDHPTATTLGHLHESYIHPDQFQLGSHWMENPILFNKVKLTNKVESPLSVAKRAASNQRADSTARATNSSSNDDLAGGPSSELSGVNDINTSVFYMSSFHKYCPRIYLTQRAKGSHEITNSIVYRFDRTEFIAVTHYQNEKVNNLKKSYNPHARGFRGSIGKVLPPVKFPVAAGEQDRGGLDKHPSLANLERPKKRTRSSLRLDENDSDHGMDGDSDPEGEAADMVTSVAMGEVNAKIGGSKSGMQSAAVAASTARVLEENISPTCRLDKENDTLVTISLFKGGRDDAKISERTTRNYFDWNAPLDGDASVSIPEFSVRFTTSDTSWIRPQSLPRMQDTSGDSLVRSSHFNGINLLQFNQYIPSFSLGPLENDLISDQTSSQAPPTELECYDLVAAQASTTLALNATSALPSPLWYRQFKWDHNTANLSQDPVSTVASAASTVVPDDVNGPGIPLTFQQLVAMNSAAAAASSSSAVGLAPSCTPNPHGVSSVYFPTASFGYDDGCDNGVVPMMTAFESGTSTPSLAIAGSSHYSEPLSITSGRSRTDSSMSGDPYRYGPGGVGHLAGSSSDSGNEFNPDPRMLNTAASTSPVTSILPSGTAIAVNDTQQTRIDYLHYENLCLKAIIRERYGEKAEFEANAVLAIKQL
ncbi:hypothetical protein BGZ96_010832 [Linnemannia gamsii]|uniref:T-box domain-containing protein n=1 Tax=Linnemannia gamsii TaxID=64522 RepID=A0ABQ7JU93_9FUNG|nr:hypothetical protein BGZ96_010832 [Linnemannia gamsii]